jgi:3-isopropylmalate/(R)-2-methylmalate dehydratase small subunit
LFNKIYADPNTTIQISIEEKKVVCDEISFSFSLDDFSQKRIIEGLDKIDITLGYVDQIESFSQSRKQWKPKLV